MALLPTTKESPMNRLLPRAIAIVLVVAGALALAGCHSIHAHDYQGARMHGYEGPNSHSYQYYNGVDDSHYYYHY